MNKNLNDLPYLILAFGIIFCIVGWIMGNVTHDWMYHNKKVIHYQGE